MNSLILLCVVFTAVLGAPVHDGTLAVDYERECRKQSKFDIWSSSFSVSGKEDYNNYILCFLQKTGYLTSEAEYRDDTTDIEKWRSENKAKSSLSDAKRLCGDSKGVTPGDTAALIIQCFVKNGII